MSQSVAGRVMPMIVVGSVDAIRSFYVDTLGFKHVMGMLGKDGRLDFCTVVMGEARIMFMRAPGGTARPAGKQPVEIYLEPLAARPAGGPGGPAVPGRGDGN